MGQIVFYVDVTLCFAEDASPEITGKIFGLYMQVWIQGGAHPSRRQGGRGQNRNKKLLKTSKYC
jgi:hypothetical protein